MLRSILLDRLKATAFAGRTPQWGGGTGAYGQRSPYEKRVDFVHGFRDRVWANRCVRYIATQSSQVKLQVRRGDQWTDEHRLIDLLKRPCRRDPAMMFFEWSIQWGEIVGDWFWEIVPSMDGGIAELFPLMSHLVEIKPGEGGPGGFVYDREQNGVDVVQYGVVDLANPKPIGEKGQPLAIFGRWPNPLDDLYGMAPMRAAKDSIVSSYFMVRYDQRFFRNSGRPDIIVGFEKADAEAMKQNKESWDDFKGVENAHRAAIFKGKPDITVLSRNPKDIEYEAGRRLTREEECAAFGVSPVLVGDLTRGTYNNLENAEPQFWKQTMIPKLAYFAAWTNAVLLPFFPDIDEFGFAVSDVPALAKAEGWRAERAAREVREGIITPNEARERLGLEELEQEGMDEIWMPTKSRPMKELLRAEPEPHLEEQPPAKQAKPTVTRDSPLPLLVTKADEAADWLRNALEAKLRFAARARTEITSHFAAQEKAIMEIVEGQEKQDEVEALLKEYGWKEDDERFREVVEAMRLGLGEKAFEITAAVLGDHTPTEGILETTLKDLADREDGIGSVSGRVKKEVLEQVSKGLQHGLTYRQIAQGGTFTSGIAGEGDVTIKGVQGVYEEYKTWQGERIARTEAAVTFNRTSATLMRDAAITHVDIADGDEDEDCALANGSRWTLAKYEGNPIGHPNCTRIGLPVIELSEPS